MKRKNLIIALLALILGIGSAFSTYAPTAAFIKIRYSTQTPGEYTCRDSDINCDNAPLAPACTIGIIDLGLTAPARGENCPTPALRHTIGVAGAYDDNKIIVQIVP